MQWLGVQVAALLGQASEGAACCARWGPVGLSVDQLVPLFSILSQCEPAGVVHLNRWGARRTLVHNATLFNPHGRISKPKLDAVMLNRMSRMVAMVARSIASASGPVGPR